MYNRGDCILSALALLRLFSTTHPSNALTGLMVNIIFKIGLNCHKRCNVPSKAVTVSSMVERCLSNVWQGQMVPYGNCNSITLFLCAAIKIIVTCQLIYNDEPRVMISQSDSFKNNALPVVIDLYYEGTPLYLGLRKRLWCCQLCQLSSR